MLPLGHSCCRLTPLGSLKPPPACTQGSVSPSQLVCGTGLCLRLCLCLCPSRLGVRVCRRTLCTGCRAETVYGLGAHALDEAAVKNIFKYKGRPPSGEAVSLCLCVFHCPHNCGPHHAFAGLPDPLIVHVLSLEATAPLLDLDDDGRAVFAQFANAFWPGPLTIVAKASAAVPGAVTAGSGFVGLRSPAHPVARALLEAVCQTLWRLTHGRLLLLLLLLTNQPPGVVFCVPSGGRLAGGGAQRQQVLPRQPDAGGARHGRLGARAHQCRERRRRGGWGQRRQL